MVKGSTDPSQPGPSYGMEPEYRSGKSSSRVFPETLLSGQPASHAKGDFTAGQTLGQLDSELIGQCFAWSDIAYNYLYRDSVA